MYMEVGVLFDAKFSDGNFSYHIRFCQATSVILM